MSEATSVTADAGEGDGGGELNALFDEARVPQSVKGAAAAVAGSGLVVALMGVQNLVLVHWLGLWMLVPIALVLVGSAGVGIGARLLRARRGSLQAGLAASIVIIVASLGFLVLGVFSGVFSMFSLFGFGGGITALVLSILALKPFERLMSTRRKLKQAGFDLDL